MPPPIPNSINEVKETIFACQHADFSLGYQEKWEESKIHLAELASEIGVASDEGMKRELEGLKKGAEIKVQYIEAATKRFREWAEG